MWRASLARSWRCSTWVARLIILIMHADRLAISLSALIFYHRVQPHCSAGALPERTIWAGQCVLVLARGCVLNEAGHGAAPLSPTAAAQTKGPYPSGAQLAMLRHTLYRSHHSSAPLLALCDHGHWLPGKAVERLLSMSARRSTKALAGRLGPSNIVSYRPGGYLPSTTSLAGAFLRLRSATQFPVREKSNIPVPRTLGRRHPAWARLPS